MNNETHNIQRKKLMKNIIVAVDSQKKALDKATSIAREINLIDTNEKLSDGEIELVNLKAEYYVKFLGLAIDYGNAINLWVLGTGINYPQN